MSTPFTSVLKSDEGAVSERSAMRRPKVGEAALSWRGRHSAMLEWHEASPSVHGAGGRPTFPGEHPPPPVLDDDVDDVVDVAEEEPVVAPLPPEPPVPELALVDSPVPLDVAVEVAPVVAVDDPWPPSPPAPPLEIGDEQAASPSAGTARVTTRMKGDEALIPGA